MAELSEATVAASTVQKTGNTSVDQTDHYTCGLTGGIAQEK